MEGRKTKHPILKEVLHYLFIFVVIGLTVTAYIFKENINTFFANDITNIEIINNILHYVPKAIVSVQIIVVSVVINFLVKIISKLGFSFTDKGKTLANLLASLLKWVIIIVAILCILSAWGVDTTSLLTGAGILALVVGLGAQSLIADVLAGIFIVLEGEYVVGDIVVIDGWRGKIVNIGIRTTQLEDIGGNVRIINNSEIRSVTNQTKHQSIANCTISVSASSNLEDVEKVILSSLKDIRKKIPAITADITYNGVTNITEISIFLLFKAKCYEEDLYQVQRDLNRELKLVLDRNNIASYAVPSITVEDGKIKANDDINSNEE